MRIEDGKTGAASQKSDTVAVYLDALDDLAGLLISFDQHALAIQALELRNAVSLTLLRSAP